VRSRCPKSEDIRSNRERLGPKPGSPLLSSALTHFTDGPLRGLRRLKRLKPLDRETARIPSRQCVHPYAHMCTPTPHTHIHTLIHMNTQTCLHTDTEIHTDAHIYTQTHTCRQTHLCTPPPLCIHTHILPLTQCTHYTQRHIGTDMCTH
jgi:hypothetical protein